MYTLTLLFSSRKYPSINRVYDYMKILEHHCKVTIPMKTEDASIIGAYQEMIKKYDKYFCGQKRNNIFEIAHILDPRFKLQFIKVYSIADLHYLHKGISDYYASYCELYHNESNDTISTVTSSRKEFVVHDMYDSYMNEQRSRQQNENPLNELEVYLNEPVFIDTSYDIDIVILKYPIKKIHNESDNCDESDESDTESSNEISSSSEEVHESLANENPIQQIVIKVMDVIAYWKDHSQRYPRLSRIAKDIFAIPSTSVPSESAFSGSSRIITKYRSNLNESSVESLMCLNDWIDNDIIH